MRRLYALEKAALVLLCVPLVLLVVGGKGLLANHRGERPRERRGGGLVRGWVVALPARRVGAGPGRVGGPGARSRTLVFRYLL